MKGRLPVVLILVLGLALVAMPNPLLADSQVRGGSIFPLDPNAPGTKLAGTLGIHYQPTGSFCGQFPQVSMNFVLRLIKGNAVSGFVGGATLCYDNIEGPGGQIETVQDFIANTVIPALFPNNPQAPFALKSVTNLAQDGQFQIAPPFFAVMDLVLAVKE